MPLATCPPLDALEQLFEGAPSEQSAEMIERHVQECSSCLARLQELLRTKDTVSGAFEEPDTVNDAAAQPAVQQLMAKLEKLKPAAEKSSDTAAFMTPSSGSPISGTDGDEPAEQDEELTVTQILHYQLVKKLGVGGMGMVYEAFDTHLERPVALKVMRPSLAKNASSRKRFLQEARSAAKIQHDHIVSIFQVGEDQGIPFLAMQLLEGASLADLLKRKGSLKPPQVIRLGLQIAEGLAAAHARGLIHRDIKPGNIWIEPVRGGRVKILDFGLARLEKGSAQLTQSGMIVGTPAYMAPEQARGEKNVDGRVDLFSLGCVLYLMSTGVMPFTGNDPVGVLMAVQMQDPPTPHTLNPEVPQGLSDVIMKLLAKDPAERLAPATEVIKALQVLERGQPSGAGMTGELAAAITAAGQPAPATAPAEPSNPFANLSEMAPVVAGSPPVVAGSPDPATSSTEGLPASGRTGDLRSGRVARSGDRATTRGWLIAAAAAFLAVIGGVFGIIRISTPEGDYVIYTDDPNFSFSVSRGGVTLRDKKADREYTLKVVRHENGTFELDVSDVGAELSFKTKELTIKRGQQVALKAWFERKHVADVRPSPDDRFALRFDEKSRWDPVPVPLELSQPFTVEGYFTVEAGGGWLFHADSQINLNSRRSTWSFHLRGQKKGSWTSNHVSFAAASNRKTHVACVYTGKEILLFLDGKLVASGNAEKDPPHPGRVALTIVNGWQGIVEEVRISQAARYQKDFTPKQRFEADAATLALYHCDEGQGDVVKDSSGNNNHGKIALAKWVKADVTAIDTSAKKYTNSLGMEFALVPKGKAWLGGGGKPGDTPVEFKDDFYLGVYEVTQEEWTRLMPTNNSYFSRARAKEAVADVSDADLKRLPVDTVNLDDITSFLKALNEREKESGWIYRLPTQAEWEYACRGGPMSDKAESAFDFYLDPPSTKLLPNQANFVHDKPLKRTWKVGSSVPNKLGLYDMHGNVLEWCNDELPPDPKDPKGAPQRALRGGAWNLFSNVAQAAYVLKSSGTFRHHDRGFRVARVRVDAPAPEADRRAVERLLATGAQIKLKSGKTAGPYLSAGAVLPAKINIGTIGFFGHPNNTTAAEIAAVVEAISSLPPSVVDPERVGLEFNGPFDDAAVERLTKVPALKQVGGFSLNGSKVTDAGLAYLAAWPGLTSTWLRGRFGDEGLRHLGRMTKLQWLNVSNAVLTGAELRHLGTLQLRTIALNQCTNLDDRAVESLAQMKSLQAIGIKKTKVSREAVARLVAALPKCHIDSDYGAFGPKAPVTDPDDVPDADRRAAEWVLSVGGEVDILANGVTRKIDGNKKLPDGLFQVVRIDVAGKDIEDADLAHLKDLTGLKSLKLGHFFGTKKLTDAFVAHLLGMTELEVLDIWGTDISDAGLEQLAALKKLTYLSMGSTKATDKALAPIGRLTDLEHLNLGRATRITDTGVKHLAKLTKLKSLSLEGTQISDDGFQHLQGLKKLTNLTLTSTKINGTGLVHLTGLTKLRDLRVDASTQFSDAGLEAIKGWTNLSKLDLRYTQISDDGLKHLHGLNRLDFLSLNSTKISGAGLAHLKELPLLRHLYLDFSKVNDAGLAQLKGWTRLSSLGLQGTQITDAELEHLRGLKELKTLNLKETKVDVEAIKKLTAALRKCQVLWDGGVIGPQGTLVPAAPSAALLALRRDQIPPAALAFAGGGDAQKAPPTLVAVLGEPEPIHTSRAVCLAFSADGRWLASGSEDLTVLLRDAASGKVLRVLRGHKAQVTGLAFTPDGKTLLSGDVDGTVKLWSTAEVREPANVALKIKNMQMAVSADGRFLAAGGLDGKVQLWKWGQWDSPLNLPVGSTARLLGLTFSRDGELLACAWEDKKTGSPIGVFTTSDGASRHTFTLPKAYGSVSFSADGKYLAAAGDRDAKVWELATGKATDVGKHAFRLCFSPVNNRLAMFANFDHRFHIYDADARADVPGADAIAFVGMVWSIAFSPDGKVLALGDHLGAVNLYDTTSWKLVPKSIEHGHRNANLAVAVSPDGQTLLSSGADNTLRRWDLTTPSKHQLVHQSNSPYLAFHPTGTTFATGGANTFVTIWDAAGPRARPALSIRLTNLVYAPDGKIFAGQGTFFDKLVHLWDAQLGQEIHRFEFVGGGKAVTLSADGTLLAAGSQQGKVGVWNVTTGKEVTSWTDTQTTSLAFHPDGGSLAIGHHDGTITFRETSAWKKLRTIRAHVGPVSTLRFTPDGKTLLSSSTDGVIQLRDPEHERAREIIPVGPSGPAVTFVLDASGQFLFATGPTPVIYVHRLSANAVGAAPAADPDRPARP